MNPVLEEIKKHEGRRFVGYQGWKRIDCKGRRPTEERLERYGLPSVLHREALVLDIGCNTGFLSLAMAPHCKCVFGIDKHDYLLEIARAAKKHLNIHNCFFLCRDFNKLSADFFRGVVFGVVVFCAAHGYGRSGFLENAKKIRSLLDTGSHLLFESHAGKGVQQFGINVGNLLSLGFELLWEGETNDNALRKFAMLRLK